MPVTIPPVVVTGDIISAAYANATRSALLITYSEIYSLTQSVVANAHSIVGLGVVSCNQVVVGIDITAPAITVSGTLTAQNINVSGALTIANITISGTVSTQNITASGTVTTPNAAVTTLLTAATVTATALTATSIGCASILLSSTGDAAMTLISTGTFQSAKIQLVARQASVNDEWNIVAAGSALASPSLRFVRGTWTGVPAMQITNAGLVGIGPVAPAATLHLSAVTPSVRISDAANEGYIIYRDAGTGIMNLAGSQSASSAYRFSTTISGVLTEIARFNNGGFLGMGTVSPAQKIHLAGGANNVIRIDDTLNGVMLQLGASSGSTFFGTYSNHPIALLTNSTLRAIIHASGAWEFFPASSIPSVPSPGQGYLYVESGQLKWKGASGTVTVIGAN